MRLCKVLLHKMVVACSADDLVINISDIHHKQDIEAEEIFHDPSQYVHRHIVSCCKPSQELFSNHYHCGVLTGIRNKDYCVGSLGA